MTDIRKLVAKLREFEFDKVPIGPLYGVGYMDAIGHAADMIEEALPEWTKITDNPDTWPEDYQDMLLSVGDGFLEAGEWGVTLNDSALSRSYSIKKYIGSYWRPLCDLDRPPEEQS